MRKTRLRRAAQEKLEELYGFPVIQEVPGHGVVASATFAGFFGPDLGRADTKRALMEHLGRGAQAVGPDYFFPSEARGVYWDMEGDDGPPRLVDEPNLAPRDFGPCEACGRSDWGLGTHGLLFGAMVLLKGTRLCFGCASRARRLGLHQAFPWLAQGPIDRPVAGRPVAGRLVAGRLVVRP